MKNIILAILIAVPFLAFGDRVTKKNQTLFSFAVNGGPTLALSKNKNRKGLIISSNDLDDIQVQFGASNASNVGMLIGSSTAYEFKNVPMDDIYIKGMGTTGTRAVGIIEFE